MLLSNLVINKDEPIYIQIKRYISNMILKGLIPNNSKLPSTFCLSSQLIHQLLWFKLLFDFVKVPLPDTEYISPSAFNSS